MIIWVLITISMAPDDHNTLNNGLNIDVQCRFNLTSPKSVEEALQYLTKNCPNLNKDKVCVVSVIGKSSLNTNACKTSLIDNQILGRNVFRGSFCSQKKVNDDTLCEIEGFFDSRNRLIVLHLLSHLDTDALVQITQNLEKNSQNEDFLRVYADIAFNTSKALLLLFIISHIVIIVNPVPYFDLTYLQLFRLLDNARLKTAPIISDILKDIPGLTDEWVFSGRPCSPRVLFLFEAHRNSSVFSKDKRKYELMLEDQIYRFLRKSRIITNICASSLFAISNQSDFVHIFSNGATLWDAQDFLLNLLQKHCSSSGKLSSNAVENESENTDKSFYHFLWPHISTALTKGFDDNVGFSSTGPVFELPVVGDFFLAIKKLGIFFFDPSSKDSNQAFSQMKSTLDIDTKFSENRCAKLLPIALSIYQEDLPPHYTSDYHEQKIEQALHYFFLQSRGSAIHDFIPRLRQECEAVWRNGRRMCEVLSMTGNHCLNPLHKNTVDGEDGVVVKSENLMTEHESTHLPVMAHCSGVKILSACNCGRRQASRDDPFSVKAANHDFYAMMSTKCNCGRMDRKDFPVFQSSSDCVKPVDLVKILEKFDHINFSINMNGFESQPEVNPASLSDLSEDLIPNQNGINCSNHDGSKSSGDNTTEIVSCNNNNADGSINANEKSAIRKTESTSTESDGENWDSDDTDAGSDKMRKVQLIIREHTRSPLTSITNAHSTTEYLPGMLHSLSPPGLLPKFSSWSLVCLGSSSLYSHNMGVQEQPGFVAGTNFLLPWDVTVKLEHSGHPPSLWEGKRPPGIKNKKTLKDGTQFTVKIFIGIEYECPRGHRFMSSKPGTILKSSMGNVKENASDIASSDMPLYVKCLCSRPGKTSFGQLMRLHVVTPKAPVHVTLNPRVQPGPAPTPTFFPGNPEPIKLSQASYWVLRLPMVYEGDQGVCLPFNDVMESSFLLKDTYGISDYVSRAKK
ncbi:nonsense-mediated mRNA decay factor SMG8 [Brevipalpus obovatus]|uniref:nonsense-mediated mRNA decay factor SMG8 n=1 Tax=Brevipalpus obovatus TaxID=246614 RepID=UPI003D9EF37D